MLVLGLNADQLVRSIPALRQAAQALGLVVFDMQAAEVALPDGALLTLPGRAPVDFTAQPEEDEPGLSEVETIALLRAELDPLMACHGFVWHASKRRYHHPTTNWWIGCSVAGGNTLTPFFSSQEMRQFELYLAGFIERDGVHVVRTDVKQFAVHAEQPEARRPDPSRFEKWSEWYIKWYGYRRRELQADMVQVKSYLAEAVLPVLDDCQDWVGLDRHANPLGELPSLLTRYSGDCEIGWLAHVFIAWMAGNRDLDSVVDRAEGYEPLLGRALGILTGPDTAPRFAEDEPQAQSGTESLADETPVQGAPQILAHMRDALQPLMARNGFTWDPARRCFARQYPDFKHLVGLVCEGVEAPFKFSLNVHLWDSPAYKALLARVKTVDLDYRFLESGLRARLGSFAHYAKVPVPELDQRDHFRMSLHTVGDLRACQAVFEAYLADAVLPVLADCADWAGVDRYCNHPPPGVEPFVYETYANPIRKDKVKKTLPAEDECPFGALSAREYWIDSLKRYCPDVDCTAKALVAYLAGNPDTAALCDQLEPTNGNNTPLLNIEFQERVRPLVLGLKE